MMPSGGDGAVAGERLAERFEVGHLVHVKPAPCGKTSVAALASSLESEETRVAILQTVVMRLDDANESAVEEAHLMAGFDGGAKRFVQAQ